MWLSATVACAQSFNFSDLAWETSVSEVRNQLAAAGFTAIQTDKDGDLRFQGVLIGYKAIGIAFFAESKLAKVAIRLITPDRKARDTYRDLKETLTKKYGPPTNSYEYFRKPYYEGDGYEEQAIRVGKARFATFWGGREPSSGGLVLEIHESLTVRLSYESAIWGAEADRRKAQATKVF
jgi:hypothetical protein